MTDRILTAIADLPLLPFALIVFATVWGIVGAVLGSEIVILNIVKGI